MGWRERLSRAIIDDELRRRDAPAHDRGEHERPDVRRYTLEIGRVDAPNMSRLVRSVNRNRIGVVAPGCLLIVRFECAREEERPSRIREMFSMQVAHRPMGWNLFYRASSGRREELRDSAGNLIYPEADFSAIPDPD
jgi:hypothetical protein